MELQAVPQEVRECLRDQIAIVVRRDRQRKQKKRKRAAEKAAKTEKRAKCEAPPVEELDPVDPVEAIGELGRTIKLLKKLHEESVKKRLKSVQTAWKLLHEKERAEDSANWWKERAEHAHRSWKFEVEYSRKSRASQDETIKHLERCLINARYGSELNEHGDTGNRRGGGRKRNWRKWFNQQPDDVLEEFGRHIKHAWCIPNEYM